MRALALGVVLAFVLAGCPTMDDVDGGTSDVPSFDAPGPRDGGEAMDVESIDAPAVDARVTPDGGPDAAPVPDAPTAGDAGAFDAPGGDAGALDAPTLDAPTLDAPTFDAPAPTDTPTPRDAPDAARADAPALPSVSIGDLRVIEGTDATPMVRLPITFSAPLPFDVTLAFTVTDGSAQVGADLLLPASTTVVAARGATSASFTVQILGDPWDELDEACTVTVTTATLPVTRGTAVLTIVDDDTARYHLAAPGPAPILSVAEGSATMPGRVVIGIGRDVCPVDGTVRVRAVPISADASDFAPYDRTWTVLAGGATSADLALPLVGDAVGELDETFRVEILDPTGGEIGPSSSVLITITNDDPPEISGCAARSVTERDTGLTRFDFVLTSSIPAPAGVRALFTIGGTASRGTDYELVGFSTMTSGVDFAVGATSAVVSIDVINDVAVETNETVTLTLIGTSTAATTSPTCTLSTLTIVEDDPF